MGFPGGARGKEPTCKCSRYKRRGSVPGSERCPGVGNGSPGQNSCLGNSTDRGAHSLKRQSSVSVVVLCPILCDPMDCSLRRLLCPGDFPARILEWVAISFSGDLPDLGPCLSLSYLLRWQADPSLLSHQGTAAIHFMMHSLSS